MKVRTFCFALLCAAGLSCGAAVAQTASSTQSLVNGSPQGIAAMLSAGDEQLSNFDLLTQSPVGFWYGMTNVDFRSRVVPGADGRPTLTLGGYVFEGNTVQFNEQGKLTQLSLEYHSDSAEDIKEAYNAYLKALGGVEPDFHRSSNGTKDVPDLSFDMMGWQGDHGEQSALARIYSPQAKQASKVPVTAGVVRFVVRQSQ